MAGYLEFITVTKNVAWIDGLVRAADLELVGVTKQDIEEAVTGFFRYGKSLNPAGLTLGIASYTEQQRLRHLIYCLKAMISPKQM